MNNFWKWFLALLIIMIVIGAGFFMAKKYFNFGFSNTQKEEEKGPNDGDQFSDHEYFDVFPVRFDEFVVPAKMYGLWPYGIKGTTKDDHNEGHPGWDFELKKGSKVYAIGDLEIFQIHDGDIQSGGDTLQVIEAWSKLTTGKYHVVYHSVKNLEPNVKEGATIKAGEPLAEAGFALSPDSAMIHFGLFLPHDSVGACPTPYFSQKAQEVLNQILAISIDTKTGQPFTSACVGKINRTLYEQNYPDRIKDLGGGEQFE